METLTSSTRRGERGQAVIELALTLPLLLLVVMGVFDFGLMFQRYEVVTNAAREGARVGVLPNYCSSTVPFTACTSAQNRALDYLATGGIGGSGVTTRTTCGGALVPNSRCVSVSGASTPITGTSPVVNIRQVTVTAEYDHQHVFVGPIASLFGGSFGTTRLRSVSTMRIE